MNVILKNKLESADQLSLILKELGEKYHVPGPIISEIDLALGELVLNIINYAYKKKKNSFISLDYDIKDDRLTFLLTDTGMAFNPLEYKPENIDAGLQDRPIGSLGIIIARKSMDSISYERKNGKNQLKLIKFIGRKQGKRLPIDKS